METAMAHRARRRVLDPSRQVGPQARQVAREVPQVLVDLLRVVLADDLLGERGHDVAGMSDLTEERVDGERRPGERGAYAPTPAGAVAAHAAARDVEPFPRVLIVVAVLGERPGRDEEHQADDREIGRA